MCDIGVIFVGLEIDITKFNKKNHNLFLSFEIDLSYQRQDSLPTHIHNIGQPIFDN